MTFVAELSSPLSLLGLRHCPFLLTDLYVFQHWHTTEKFKSSSSQARWTDLFSVSTHFDICGLTVMTPFRLFTLPSDCLINPIRATNVLSWSLGFFVFVCFTYWFLEAEEEERDVNFVVPLINVFLDQFFYLFIYRLYLFVFREGRREGEKEWEKHWCVRDNPLSLMHPQLGTWPATQACALTWNQTSDPLVRPALSPLSHTRQCWNITFDGCITFYFMAVP